MLELNKLDMNISNNKYLNILDLPNEILLIIFNKLNMVDVLYSLVNVTQRLDQLILNSHYIHSLDLTSMKMKSFFDRIYSIDDQILDKICQNILPEIHHQVNELILEQHSIEYVIHTINYPQLYSLSLIAFQEEILLNYLLENTTLRKLLTEQITCLKIDVKNNTTPPSLSENLSTIFALILSLCKRLIELNFGQFYHRSAICTFQLSSKKWKSSILTVLKISVQNFDDCLYLLDERLNCLSTLIIIVKKIEYTLGTIDNTKKLPRLKYFSLTSFTRIVNYDNLIIPLLRRMMNLEELILFLLIIRIDKNYIDGTQLYDDFLVYMPRLNKFTFSIDISIAENNSQICLSSNEDIQRSFIRKEYGPVYSYVETFSKQNESRWHIDSLTSDFKSRCHIYSLPYQFQWFDFLNNSFQGGMFNNVRSLKMMDLRPFEHNFFTVISQSFPLLELLYIFNDKAQQEKEQSRTCLMFPHLIVLNVSCAHVDYAEQFLFDKYCHLPYLLNLSINYESLILITNNFTNDAARLTCSKLTSLRVKESFVPPENFHQYFPLL